MLLFLTEPMQDLPKAALGAVIVAAAIGLVDRQAWRGLARTSRVEVAITAVTLAGVVAVGVLEALVVAVALSIVDVVRRSATPHDAVLGWVDRQGRYADIRLHPPGQDHPRGARLPAGRPAVLRQRQLRQGPRPRGHPWRTTPVDWFVFDGEGLTHIDATGVDALTELIRSLRSEQITFVFARLKGPIRQKLRQAGVLDLVGEAHFYPTVQSAVQAARPAG